MALGTGRAADPVRIAVYTSNPQQLPDALGEFERVNGKGLIELVVMDGDTPPEKVAAARVIYAYLMNAAMYARFAPAARKAAAAGAVIMAQPPDIAEHRWGVKPDVKASASAYEYWYNGGADNLSAFLAYCYKLGGGERAVAVPAPQQHIVKGIYHPRADKPFESLSDYLAWYRAQRLIPAERAAGRDPFLSDELQGSRPGTYRRADRRAGKAWNWRGAGFRLAGSRAGAAAGRAGALSAAPAVLLQFGIRAGFRQRDAGTLRTARHRPDDIAGFVRSVEQVRLRDHARAVVHAGGAAGDRGRYRADRSRHHGEGRGRGRSGDQADTGTNRYGGQPRRALAGVAREAERGKAHRPDLLQQPAGQGKHRRQLPERLPDPGGGAGAAARKRIPDRRPAAHRKRAGSATGDQRPQYRGMGSR